MSWLQKRTPVSDAVQMYTTGLNKTALLVGLGNVGKEYELTRHNAGFICLDAFVSQYSGDMEPWVLKKDLKCMVSTGRVGETRVIAIKPTTMMNLSGEAVQAISTFYKIPVGKVCIIHDELDIDFGHIRMRSGGGSAGHNGIKSVTQHMGENYGRVRIGIGPKKPAQIDSADFVLQQFSKTEQAELSNMAKEVTAILSEYIYGNQLPVDTRSFLF